MCDCCFLKLSLDSTLAGDNDHPDLDTFPVVADPHEQLSQNKHLLGTQEEQCVFLSPLITTFLEQASLRFSSPRTHPRKLMLPCCVVGSLFRINFLRASSSVFQPPTLASDLDSVLLNSVSLILQNSFHRTSFFFTQEDQCVLFILTLEAPAV